MTQISILIPQRDAADAVAAQVLEVCDKLGHGASDFEVIVVDDASPPHSLSVLEDLGRSLPSLRLLRLSPACGLSAALTVGIAAAEGDHIVTLPAGDLHSPTLINPLLDELVRSDLVVGRPVRQGMRKALHRLKRIPR